MKKRHESENTERDRQCHFNLQISVSIQEQQYGRQRRQNRHSQNHSVQPEAPHRRRLPRLKYPHHRGRSPCTNDDAGDNGKEEQRKGDCCRKVTEMVASDEISGKVAEGTRRKD